MHRKLMNLFYEVRDPALGWDDIGGYADVKETLKEMVCLPLKIAGCEAAPVPYLNSWNRAWDLDWPPCIVTIRSWITTAVRKPLSRAVLSQLQPSPGPRVPSIGSGPGVLRRCRAPRNGPDLLSA